MEYKIVSSSDLNLLSNLVNEEIKKGWKPQGGIGEARFAGHYQPMIKE